VLSAFKFLKISKRLVKPAAEAPENVFQCQDELPCLSFQLAWPLDVSLEESEIRPENGTIDILTLPVKVPLNRQ
jgi:hypothetical protein